MRKATPAAVCIAAVVPTGAVAAVATAMRAQVVAGYVWNSLEIEQPYGGSVLWSELEKHPEALELYRGIGFGKEFNASSSENLRVSITETISCANCHSGPDMQRAITSPALVRGLAGIGMDAATTTQDDMKMLACAQCHAEYYFAKPGNMLTFPWAQRTTPADIERYYESIGFVDWLHTGTGYGMIKVQ